MTHKYQLVAGVTAVLLFFAIAASVLTAVGASASPGEIRNTLLRLNDQAIQDRMNIAINWAGNALIISLGGIWYHRFRTEENTIAVTLGSLAMCSGGLLLAAAQLPHLGAAALAGEYGASSSVDDAAVSAAARALLNAGSFGAALSMSLVAIATLIYGSLFVRMRDVPTVLGVLGLAGGATTLVAWWLPRLIPALWPFFKWMQIPLLVFLLMTGTWMVYTVLKDRREQSPSSRLRAETSAASSPS